jgi:Methyltransferase domain
MDYNTLMSAVPVLEEALDVWITPKLGFKIDTNPPGYIFPLLEQRFEQHLDAMKRHADEVREFIFSPKLERIPEDKVDETTPYWANGYFYPGDARLAYAVVARYRPRTIVEVGCGNSTKFMRRAASDYSTGTTIICVDPDPRANVVPVADEFYRTSGATVDIEVFRRLQSGDVLFIDGSHLVMNGSEVVHLFLNVLPLLPRGVWVHLHDVFLPYDYPYDLHINCRYNEQYLLGAVLLYSNEWIPALPIYYAFQKGILPHGGGSFWMRKA